MLDTSIETVKGDEGSSEHKTLGLGLRLKGFSFNLPKIKLFGDWNLLGLVN
jgi:hypothetical protein